MQRGIAGKHRSERSLDENVQLQIRPPLMQRLYQGQRQDGVSKGSQANQQKAGCLLQGRPQTIRCVVHCTLPRVSGCRD